jgi:hypothetical protein
VPQWRQTAGNAAPAGPSCRGEEAPPAAAAHTTRFDCGLDTPARDRHLPDHDAAVGLMAPKLSKPVSPPLNLSPQQIAAAHRVGVAFPPATPAQVQRLAMQRKVFRIAGTAVLATRDGTFFETAATLAPLIAEGERQQRDLAAWEAAAPVAEIPAPPREPERPADAALAPTGQAAPDLELATAPEPALPLEADVASAEGEAPAPAGVAVQEPQTEATSELVPLVLGAAKPTVPAAPVRKAPRGERWLTAGAERRGRLVQHWSRRR